MRSSKEQETNTYNRYVTLNYPPATSAGKNLAKETKTCAKIIPTKHNPLK